MTTKSNNKGESKPITKETILSKIADLEKRRDNYIEEANKQVIAFTAAIDALKLLLEEDKPEEKNDS